MIWCTASTCTTGVVKCVVQVVIVVQLQAVVRPEVRPRLLHRVVSQPGQMCALDASTEPTHRKPVPTPRKNRGMSLQNPEERAVSWLRFVFITLIWHTG